MLESGVIVAGRYEVEHKIGTGGMSDVYKAKDHTLGRCVAIKVLKEEFCADASFVSKFHAEAQAAAGLEHPNIVNIYDVGSQDGFYYIIMEYVQGITLKTYIEKKSILNYKETLSIAIQVARGIQVAHAKNIIHRDIKPQNIIISTDGKVKVTDFGIARAVSENTIHADVMGSVHYAAPEQTRNGYVSNRSDIYSLGIVMYEMITGRVPFDGESTVSIAIKHLQEEMVAPSVYAPNIPISLEKIILKCTQKSQDRRYESMESLLLDLRKSLLSPNEDFVTIAAIDASQTRVMSSKEVDEIQKSTPVIPKDEDDEKGKYDYIYEDDDDEDDDDEGFFNAKMEKIVKILSIAVFIIIVLIVVYLVGSFFGYFNFSKSGTSEELSVEEEVTSYEMISLLGMTVEEAEAAFEELEYDVTVSVKEEEETEDYEAGQIISQDVEEGDMIDVGGTVYVVIAKEPEAVEVTVPDVVGYTSDAAMTMLQDKGLEVDRQFKYDSSVEAGKVISQTPTGGTTALEGDTVTIYVSQGTETTKVPDLTGTSESAAKSSLGDSGLNVGSITYEYSDTVEEGYVISQGTTAGSYVDMGSSVSFVVSKGAKEKTYYCARKIEAPTNVEIAYADIELIADESDEVIESWSNITAFPYTITTTGITGYTQGVLVITWYYYDSEDNIQSSVQEASVTFTEE